MTLKECPFCHKDGDFLRIESEYDTISEDLDKHFVKCMFCEACGPSERTPKGAAELWNRRDGA